MTGGFNLGAGATTLRTATMAPVHSTAQYCLSTCYYSVQNRLINKLINDAFFIKTACLYLTPIDNLYVLAGILPIALRLKRAMLSLTRQVQRPEHILNESFLSSPHRGHRQLKSRHPFLPAALELLKDFFLVGHQCCMLGGNQIESGNGKVIPPAHALLSPRSTPNHWECTYPDHSGSGLIASALVLVYSV